MDDRIHKVGWIEFKGPELRQTSRGCLIRSGRREMVSTLGEPGGWCVVHGMRYMLMAGQTSVGGPCIHIERGRGGEKNGTRALIVSRIRMLLFVKRLSVDHENIRLRILGKREEKTGPSSKRRAWIERSELSVRG